MEGCDGWAKARGGLAGDGRGVGRPLPRRARRAARAALAGAVAAAARQDGGRDGGARRRRRAHGPGVGRLVPGGRAGRGGAPPARRGGADDPRAAHPRAARGARAAGAHRRLRDGEAGDRLGGGRARGAADGGADAPAVRQAAAAPQAPAPRLRPRRPSRPSGLEGGGLARALTAAGVRAAQVVAWADEMRLGLHGQVRRRWTPRGVKLRLKVEVRYVWRYLALAVEPTGRLRWRWLSRMRKEQVAEAIAQWRAEDRKR